LLLLLLHPSDFGFFVLVEFIHPCHKLRSVVLGKDCRSILALNGRCLVEHAAVLVDQDGGVAIEDVARNVECALFVVVQD
jgi:hypothetical protein